MPQIIVTAAVNDVQEWLRFKAEMVPAMSAVASDGASYVAAMAVTRSPAHGTSLTGRPPRQPRAPSLRNWRRRRRRSEPG